MLNINSSPNVIDSTPNPSTNTTYEILLLCNITQNNISYVPQGLYTMALAETIGNNKYNKIISVITEPLEGSPMVKNKFVTKYGDEENSSALSSLISIEIEDHTTNRLSCVSEELISTLVALTDCGYEDKIKVTLAGFNTDSSLLFTALELIEMGVQISIIEGLCQSTNGKEINYNAIKILKNLTTGYIL